ncbi:unnamed protein product [Lota lota]
MRLCSQPLLHKPLEVPRFVATRYTFTPGRQHNYRSSALLFNGPNETAESRLDSVVEEEEEEEEDEEDEEDEEEEEEDEDKE